MGILAVAADERVADVSFDQDALGVRLKDGRTISVPLAWYPRLFHATAEQRRNWKIAGGGYGIHWPEIDEDISTEGLLRGAPAPQDINGEMGLKPRIHSRERHVSGKAGLDDRWRDHDGEIRKKSASTLVGTLREKYGDSFAPGYRSDTRLGTFLDREGYDSLSEYLKNRQGRKSGQHGAGRRPGVRPSLRD
jgi:hypothetical protein